MTDVRIVNAEALIVGRGEILVLKFPDTEESREYIGDVMQALNDAGLGGRALVFMGEVELTKVAK